MAATMRLALGIVPIPWQQYAADVAGEVDPATALFKRSIVVITVPRQCGKTTLGHGWGALRCLSIAGTRLAYTAQTHKDARERWMEGLDLLRRGGLRGMVTPRLSAGSERFDWDNTSSLRLFAPQPDALHGSALDGVHVDEGFAFDLLRGGQLEQAILPTFTTRRTRPPGPQLWITSTAGDPGSSWLRRWVDLGRAAADDPGSPICYVEYAAAPDEDPYDEAVWAARHPGLGHVAGVQALRDAAAVMEPAEFARAFLNVWTEGAGGVFGPAWAAVLDVEAVAPERGVALAVDVAFDRGAASIGAAVRREDGRVHLEVVEHRAGTGWVVDRVVELQKRWRARVAGDPAGPAGSVIADMLTRGMRVELIRGSGYAAACGALHDAVLEGRVVHIGQADLDDAVAAASRRPMGDAWAWGRRSSDVDVSPLVAVTLAHALASRRQPRATIRVSGSPAPTVTVRSVP